MKVMVESMFVMVTLGSCLTIGDSSTRAEVRRSLGPRLLQEWRAPHRSQAAAPHPRPAHRRRRRQAEAPDVGKAIIDTKELYAFCLNISSAFQSHVRRDPAGMSLLDFREHLRRLFVELDFLPFVSRFLGGHVGAVSAARDVRALYNLLDLYSALERLRQRYLQKVMERFQALADQAAGIPGRHYLSPHMYMIPALARHVRAIRTNMTALYKSVLEPKADNVEFVARYQAGAMAKLDRMMANISLPSPFLAMDEGRGYVLRPADQPGLQLNLRGSHGSWRLEASSSASSRRLMASDGTEPNATSPSSVFSFKPVPGAYNSVQYLLTCAFLPAEFHLIIPRNYAASRKEDLYFGAQEGGALDVMKLPGGEHVLVHKIKGVRDQVLYLSWVTQDARVGFTSSYPGREAHWLFQDTK